jgi:predicted small lipoprotein YifL
MNPILARVLICCVAGAVHALLGDELKFESAVDLLTGVMVGWGLLPRPGDKTRAYRVPMLMLLALALSVQACGQQRPFSWPDALKCAPGIPDIIGVVSRVLLSDGSDNDLDISERGKAELTRLAVEHGADTVACVVDKLVDDWTSPGRSLHPTTLAAAARGQDFLNEIGVGW